MNIPTEFADYMISKEPLLASEQEERLTKMRTDEIIYRAELMAHLGFDRDITSHRIKKNFEWAYEFGKLPAFYKSIDSLVGEVYDKFKIG